MAKRKKPLHKKPRASSGKRAKRRPKSKRKAPRTLQIVLDHDTLDGINRAKARTQAELAYQRDYFFELAAQRHAIQDELIKTIAQNVEGPFTASGWQRAVKWRYSNATAERELLGQGDNKLGLSNHELALTNRQSISVVSLSLRLERVFDLRKARPLMPFVKLIQTFTLSEGLKKRAQNLQIQEPKVVTKATELRDTLLDKNWRLNPMRFDVPANPQVFGQLAHEAGVQGIIYPSKMTKKATLAVFPRNLASSHSFVELDHTPPPSCVFKRLGSGSWPLAEQPLENLALLH